VIVRQTGAAKEKASRPGAPPTLTVRPADDVAGVAPVVSSQGVGRAGV